MKKSLVLTAAVFSLAACATQPPMAWVKAGTTQQDFNVDKYACMHDSSSAAPPSAGLFSMPNGTLMPVDVNRGNRNQLFSACMNAKGWNWQAVNQNNGTH